MSETSYAETEYPSFPPLGAIDDESVDLPVISGDAEDDYETGAEGDESADETGTGAASGPRAALAKPNKAFIRKVAAKAIEVNAAEDSTRILAAALLGTSEDTVDLVAGIMTAGRGAGQPLADIGEIVTALKEEPWEAGVIATALDAARQKAVWNVLYARDAVGSPTQPKSQQKAGSAIVKAINGLTEADKTGLTAAGDLLKRS